VIKRIFWFGVGIGLTVLVISKAPKTLGALVGSRSIAGGLLDEITGFISDIRGNMAEREEELLATMGDG
jgi:hypothetical protein